jgi:hypothetical protein
MARIPVVDHDPWVTLASSLLQFLPPSGRKHSRVALGLPLLSTPRTIRRMLAAVVLDALGAPLDLGLDRAIGAGAAKRLRRELRAVARRWVAALAPGNAFEATTAAAAQIALDGQAGPVVLVAPDIPALGPAHARAILDDLAGGTALVVGAAHDSRPYVVALATADDALITLAADGWEALMAAASERALAVAMLRPERRLASAGDARALALDPLAPPLLLAQLGDLRPDRRSAP